MRTRTSTDAVAVGTTQTAGIRSSCEARTWNEGFGGCGVVILDHTSCHLGGDEISCQAVEATADA